MPFAPKEEPSPPVDSSASNKQQADERYGDAGSGGNANGELVGGKLGAAVDMSHFPTCLFLVVLQKDEAADLHFHSQPVLQIAVCVRKNTQRTGAAFFSGRGRVCWYKALQHVG